MTTPDKFSTFKALAAQVYIFDKTAQQNPHSVLSTLPEAGEALNKLATAALEAGNDPLLILGIFAHSLSIANLRS